MSVSYVGGDADFLLHLSRACSEAAAELRACRFAASAAGGPALVAELLGAEQWAEATAHDLRRRAALLEFAARVTADHPAIAGAAELDAASGSFVGDALRTQARTLERDAAVAVGAMRVMAASLNVAAEHTEGLPSDVSALIADVPELAADVVEASVGGVVDMLRDLGEVADDVEQLGG